MGGSAGNGPSQFNNPSGIAVDSIGDIYVVDNGNHRIQKFTRNGDFIRNGDHLVLVIRNLCIRMI